MSLLLVQTYAQYRGGWGRGRRLEIQNAEEERENELMEKAIDPAFKEDVFTFARLKFDADRGYGRCHEQRRVRQLATQHVPRAVLRLADHGRGGCRCWPDRDAATDEFARVRREMSRGDGP